MLCLWGINPGIVGHKIIPKIMDKIADLKKKLIKEGKRKY